MEVSVSHIVAVVTILVSVYPGNTEPVCDFDRSCLPIYNNMKGLFEEQHTNEMAILCSLSHDLKDCMKKTSRRCRGDLNYHFFEKLVRDLNGNIGVGKNCAGGLLKGGVETNSSDASSGSPSLSHNSHHGSHHRNHGRQNGRGSSRGLGPGVDRCASKVSAEAPTVGCALFGLTNLKSFSETLNYTDINYCSLAGAWSLIDTPEFAVQITNKGGLSPLPKDITATTLVTVIIKSNQCSERKTYQATFDEVPGMFSDGYTTAGNVYIETITESEHVKIHFPYLSTTIDVIKVIDKIPIPSLTVAIKMPESLAQSFMTEPKRLRGLPLCFYGCPRTATIKPRSTDGHTARSVSPTTTSYYKSTCPNPEVHDEQPQSDSSGVVDESIGDTPAVARPVTPKPISPKRPSLSQEEAEFSSSLSAEFLSQGGSSSGSFANSDFGGQRSQRSSSSSTAVICASLNSVHEILSESSVIGQRLSFPGEESLGDSSSSSHHHHSADSSFVNVMNSALTSQSSPVSRFHCIFVYLTVILVFHMTWS